MHINPRISASVPKAVISSLAPEVREVPIGDILSIPGHQHVAGCRIYYARRPELETAEEKLEFLSSAKFGELALQEIRPDATHYWLNLTSNDFDALLPIASRAVKQSKGSAQQRAIFRLYSQGLKTNRDDWVCDLSSQEVIRRTQYLINTYNAQLSTLGVGVTRSNIADRVKYNIKWTRKLKNLAVAGRKL